MFNTTGPHYCPVCPKWRSRKGSERGQELILGTSNYSGCGVDIANCSECGKGFQISYKVDEVTHVPDWDGGTRVEREASELRWAEESKQREIAAAKAVLEKHGAYPLKDL